MKRTEAAQAIVGITLAKMNRDQAAARALFAPYTSSAGDVTRILDMAVDVIVGLVEVSEESGKPVTRATLEYVAYKLAAGEDIPGDGEM